MVSVMLHLCMVCVLYWCNCWQAVKYSPLDLPVRRGLLTSLVLPSVFRSIDLIRFIQIDNPENIVGQYDSHVF